MTKKKVEEVPEHIRRFKEIYNRYQRNYTIIVLLGLAAVFAVHAADGLALIAFFFCNAHMPWLF